MKLPDYFEFTCMSKTGTGRKALSHLPVDLNVLNARKPMILTKKMYEHCGIVKAVIAGFKDSGMTLGIYDNIRDNASMETVRELTNLFLDGGYDALIAVGGGPVVDVAKMLNIVVSGESGQYKKATGLNNISWALKPFVYIPVDTGKSTESAGELTFEDFYYASPKLMPNLVVTDPAILFEESLPFIMNSLLSALTFCVEAYTSNDANPIRASYSNTCIRLIFENLLDKADDMLSEKGRISAMISSFKETERYANLINAAVLGGVVYSNTLGGAATKIGRELSRLTGTLPGFCMGIVLPYVVEKSAIVNNTTSEKLYLAIAGIDTYCSTPSHQRFSAAVAKLREISNELYRLTASEIPRTLKDIGVTDEIIQSVSESLGKDTSLALDSAAVMDILSHAREGKPFTL